MGSTTALHHIRWTLVLAGLVGCGEGVEQPTAHTSPLPESPPSLAVQLDHSDRHLRVESLPDSPGQRVVLGSRFRQVRFATVNEQGELELPCVSSPESARKVLGVSTQKLEQIR